MRSHTNLEQSKNLANILPIESADMYYEYVLPKSDKIQHNPEIGNPVNALKWYNKGYTMHGKEPITLDEYCVPCWSLAALLAQMPCVEMTSSDDGYYRVFLDSKFSNWYNNPVDACMELLERVRKEEEQ